jgi:hypothetical protein
MTNQNPMAIPRTVEGQQGAALRIQEREASSPHIVGLGVEPDSGLAGLNTAFAARIAEDPNAQFSDDSLKEYQDHVEDYSGVSTDKNSAFAFGPKKVHKVQSQLWKELAASPKTPKARQEWLKKYKEETAKAMAEDEAGLDTKPKAPIVPGGMVPREPPISGNPFGWAVPGGNTFQ